MSTILWQGSACPPKDEEISTEQCKLVAIAGGYRLSGLVLTVADRRPIHIVYQVDVDERWRTRSVRATKFGLGAPVSMYLDTSGSGTWSSGGLHVAELDDCLDVDLEWTPATNTLPIRRLSLDVGGSAGIAAAWVRFDDFSVERLAQVYERLDATTWRYRSANYSAILKVDGEGLVLDYENLWRAVAHSDPEALGPKA